jgi:hypothetical protein
MTLLELQVLGRATRRQQKMLINSVYGATPPIIDGKQRLTTMKCTIKRITRRMKLEKLFPEFKENN